VLVIQPVCRLITFSRNVGSVGSGVQSVQTSSVQLQAGHVRRQAGQCIKQTTWHVERGSLRTLSETADERPRAVSCQCHRRSVRRAPVTRYYNTVQTTSTVDVSHVRVQHDGRSSMDPSFIRHDCALGSVVMHSAHLLFGYLEQYKDIHFTDP